MNTQDYQIEMEKLFHKNQLIPRIKAEFTSMPEFHNHMILNGIPLDFGYDLLVQMVLHKRAGLPILVGLLRKHFAGDCQQTADMILKAAQADLVDWSAPLLTFIIRYDITPDVQMDLDRYQYPLPMIIDPKELKKNTDTGYYTYNASVILKDNHHDGDVCLDHLNAMNRIKLSINHDVAHMIHNQWKNLDKPKEGESKQDFDRRKKQFAKYDRTAKDVMAHLAVADNVFHLTHRYDKRGRTYSQGYHVNYQGNTWNKAVIEFAHQEVPN